VDFTKKEKEKRKEKKGKRDHLSWSHSKINQAIIFISPTLLSPPPPPLLYEYGTVV